MNSNKYIMGSLSLGFLWLVLTLCSCKTSHDPYVSLAQLQDSLKQGGDSISFYCIKEKYAVWIHDEEEIDDTFGLPLQSLYYYDLGTKVRTKLFTTQRDSVYLLPDKSKSLMMWGIGAIASSNDSLALLINDFEGDILMIPTRKIDSVSVLVLGNHIIDLPENDDIPLEDLQAYTFSSYEASEGEYYAMEYVEIPQTNQQGYDTSWKVQKKLIYTTTGEYVRTHPQATIYLGNGKEPFEIPVEMLDDQAEVKKEIIVHLAYHINDLYTLANNAIQFEETFNNSYTPDKLHYFALRVNAIQEIPDMDNRDSNGNYGKRLRVDGEDFSIYTTDRSFANLSYPCQIIIQAKVHDLEKRMNGFFGLFGGGLGLNTDARFSFTKAQLLYSAQ